MPILMTHLSSGYSPEQKSALLQQTTEAVVQALNAPLPNIRVFLQEYAADMAMAAGQAGAGQLVYFAYLIEGRSDTLKATLIAGLSAAAHRALGISEDDIRVVIHDIAKADMGLAGGITAVAAGR